MNGEWKPKTVEDLVCYWLLSYARAYKAPSSIRRDEGMARLQILPYFGSRLLTSVHTRELERWLLTLRDSAGLCEKSCNDALGLFRKILNDGIRWGFVTDNPAARVRKFTMHELDYKHWVGAQMQKFFAYFAEVDPKPLPYWAIAIALLTGMRRGELVALSWDCVDFESRLITVRASYCRILKADKPYAKSGAIRHIPICQALFDLLVLLKPLTLASGKVIPKMPIDALHREVAFLANAVGVPVIRFHDLRHTFASNYLKGGGTIYDLQKILGHSTIQVTERYAHLEPKALRGKTDMFNQWVR